MLGPMLGLFLLFHILPLKRTFRFLLPHINLTAVL